MKITLSKKEFTKHLDNISKALSGVSPLPSLQGMVIDASESNITLLASNGNLSIKEVIENENKEKVQQPGKILVPGSLFKNLISNQAEVITLEAKENILEVSSEGMTAQINLLDITEYPIISFEVVGKDLTIDTDKFKSLISDVSYAASTDSNKVIFNGINLKASNGQLKASATNSYRLATKAIEIDQELDFDITILSKDLRDFIPAKAKGEIIVKVDDSKILTSFGSTTILSRLVDGVYPSFDHINNINYNKVLTIDSTTLKQLIDRVTVVSDESRKIVRFQVSGNELTIESKKREMGSSKVKTTDFDYEGDDILILFNAQFLKDALNKVKGKVQVKLVAEFKPFIVSSESKENFIQLILPHRSF